MARTRNGVCQEKNEDLSRVHTMTTKTRPDGSTFESCDRCGAMFVSTRIITNEDNDTE
jgi:hypothetical protein